MRRAILTIAAFCSMAPISGVAVTCNMLSYNVDDARSKLRRAANESTLEDAKDQARRAKSALEDAAQSAMDCKCDMAYSEFDDAAVRARRARDASDPDEFVDNLNRSIRSYNSALQALRLCAASRR